MAIAQLNPTLERVHGKFGNQLYRCYGSKVNVIPLPDYSRRRRSKLQKETSRIFAKAHADTQRAMADPVLRAWFAQGKTPKYKTLHGFIMAEYLRRAREKSGGAPPAQNRHRVLEPDFAI